MQRRKDNKGRVLKDGEVYRKSDGLYMYRWTAKNGKRHTIYDATLEGLREKEEKKKKKKEGPSWFEKTFNKLSNEIFSDDDMK